MSNRRQDVRETFSSFAEDYTIAPLWYWNDDLYEAEIVRQLKLMKTQHVFATMIMPMAGLNLPYPSPGFFDKIRFAVKAAKKLGMKIWFYDEYCWPSGLAGGLINEKYPEYLQPRCRCFKYPLPANASRDFVRPLPEGRIIFAQAVRKSDGREINLRDCAGDHSIRWQAPSGEWEITLFSIHKISHVLDTVTAARWSNNMPGFVDCLNRAAMAKFIELVYEEYYRVVPEEFGKTVRGFFFDEPSFLFDYEHHSPRHGVKKLGVRSESSRDSSYQDSLNYADEPDLYGLFRSIPWTRDMLFIFKQKYGYDLRRNLGGLVSRRENDRKVCYDFYKLASDLFAENYAAQLGRWCAAHKVSLTGHWGEGAAGGDYYKQLRPMQAPGIDLLGDVSSVKRLLALPRKAASAARMLGRERVMAETFGASPWNLELSGKLAVCDLLNVMGINLIVPIDYAYSFRSFRKHTSNPPGFYQASNWKYQRYFSDHTARLSFVTTMGKAAVKTAIFHSADERLSQALLNVDRCFEADDNELKTLRMLCRAQIEADILFDTALREDAEIRNGRIRGRDVAYDIVVLPEMTIIGEEDLRLLSKFVKGGGTLVIVYNIPLTAPDGKSLQSAWKQLFGLPAAIIPKIKTKEEKTWGRGKIVMLPDPADCISVSAERLWQGEKINPFDGTDAVMQFDWNYPHWLAVDFGETLDLREIIVTLEDSETHTEYRLQTSTNGRNWTGRISVVHAGGTQKGGYEFAAGDVATKPDNFRTRYLRIFITRGGHRFFGIRKIKIIYMDSDGNKKCWIPPGYRSDMMADVIPPARPDIIFYNEENKVAADLIPNVRRLDNLMITAVINNTGKERHLTARAAGHYSIETWDPDTGKTGLVTPADGAREFPITFAPYEVRVFVLGKEKINRCPAVSLDRRRETVAEIKGPWKFKAERRNALPLAVCNLQIADPAYPGKWYPAKNGRIPEELRLVPSILFKCDFKAHHPSGKEEILFEKNIQSHLAVNGQLVTEKAKPDFYLDESGLSVPVGKYLKKGKNRVSGVYSPEIFERDTRGACYHYTKLQPSLDVFLLGDFSVKGSAIIRPVEKLTNRPWQEQGYPFYSGTGIYTAEINCDKNVPLWLEADIYGAILELSVNGRPAGVCVKEPYLFDLTPHVQRSKGTHKIELRVTNAIGSFLSGQEIGSLASSHKGYQSGLKSLRLVKFTRNRR